MWWCFNPPPPCPLSVSLSVSTSHESPKIFSSTTLSLDLIIDLIYGLRMRWNPQFDPPLIKACGIHALSLN